MKADTGISIHALLAESDSGQGASTQPAQQISIHALLAESDALGLLGWLRVLISIHALLAESDPGKIRIFDDIFYFYPRSPCGERPMPGIRHISQTHFYPRSPCGERQFQTLR